MPNYIIARIENYKMGAVGGVGKEQERETHYIEKYYQNPDFDPEKTKDNITLVHDPERDGKTWERYIKEYRENHNIAGRFTTKGADKSQTNVMVGFMVTTSKEYMDLLDKCEQELFFKDAFESIREQYPTYHFVEVTIHRDEKTPHMQALALPIYHNLEKDRYEFSTTKTQVGKEHYREFQDRLYADISKKWCGLERGVKGNEREHLSVKQYKQFKELEKKIQHENAILKKEQETFQRDKDRYNPPTMQKTVLGAKYKRGDVEKVVQERNQAYAELDRLKEANRELKEMVMQERENAIAWEKSGRQEHEKRLDIESSWNDSRQVRIRLCELEKEHNSQHDREMDRR